MPKDPGAPRPSSPAGRKRARPAAKKAWRLIGLTGTNGAGKGEAAAFLSSKGFDVFSLSDVIREELEKSYRPLTRDNLIRAGNTLRKRFGADILARRILRRVTGDSVIDSIRNPAEVRALRRRAGFLLLAVDAPPAVRFARVRKRGRDESASTLEAFKSKEREEMSLDRAGQQLQVCMALADVTIINDSSLEHFHRQLEKIL